MADFRYVETITTSQKVLNTIVEEVDKTRHPEYPYEPTAGESPVPNMWEVFDKTETPEGFISELILKGTITIGDAATPQTKDFYVKFINHALVDRTYPSVNLPSGYKEHSTMSIQILEDYDETTGDFKLKGHPVLYQWADEKYKPTDRDEKKPVYMYLNVKNNRLAMVLVADPAVNFNDYRKSFMYVGAIEPFKYNMYDIDGNVALTAGCLLPEPSMADIANEGIYYFGEYTSVGNNTIQMLRTKSGIEFQRHYPAFITQAPKPGKAYVDPVLGDTGLELEQQGFQQSRWTQKYHLSPVYIVHPYEGYRGKLDGVVAVTKHNILHLDELIIDVEGKPWKQEVYRYFDIDTPQNFMNLSPNQDMGVAVLKEVRY